MHNTPVIRLHPAAHLLAALLDVISASLAANSMAQKLTHRWCLFHGGTGPLALIMTHVM